MYCLTKGERLSQPKHCSNCTTLCRKLPIAVIFVKKKQKFVAALVRSWYL